MTRGLLFGYDDGGHDDARDEEEGGAPSESVDRGIIPIEQRSIQSSPDPYDWSALRTRTRGGASLSQALPCHAPAGNTARNTSGSNPSLCCSGKPTRFPATQASCDRNCRHCFRGLGDLGTRAALYLGPRGGRLGSDHRLSLRARVGDSDVDHGWRRASLNPTWPSFAASSCRAASRSVSQPHAASERSGLSKHDDAVRGAVRLITVLPPWHFSCQS